jgi:hypothetical protein
VEPSSKENKLEMVRRLENKSQREGEKILATHFPEFAKRKERVRELSESQTELKMVMDCDLIEKLEKLKSLYSHQLKDQSYEALIRLMAEKLLKQTEPKRSSTPAQESHSRYISKVAKALIWKRAQARCEFIDQKSKHRCPGRRFLQLDHIQPFARGGPSTVENLRLLCQTHNLHAAAQEYGEFVFRR